MKHKLRIKKSGLIILSIFFILLLFIIFKPNNYHIDYKINNYNIYEEYNNKEYYFKINKDNIIFDYYLKHDKFFFKRQIKDIKEYINDKYTCIIPIIDKIETYPLCYNGNNYIDYHLVDDDMLNSFNNYIKEYNNIDETYNNIKINNLVNKSYLIWNYHDFISLTNNGYKTINIFNKDYYDISLASIINNYMVIPNYDQEYNFNEFIIINLNNLKKEIWNIKYDISYDSYILGTYDKSIYLVDKKNKVEYEYVPSKKKIRIVGSGDGNGTIYDNGYKKISMNKLINEDNKFNYGYSYNYEINNNRLILKTINNNMLVSNNNIDDIIYHNYDEIFYKYNTSIYYYSPLSGEVKVMDNFEWNFNYKNMIFIY